MLKNKHTNIEVSDEQYNSIILSDVLEMIAQDDSDVVEAVKSLYNDAKNMEDFRQKIIAKYQDADFKEIDEGDKELR